VSDDVVRPLPEAARLLHIGPQKTGSTAIQVSLRRARAELLGNGVVYPGSGSRPRHAGWALGIRGGPIGKPPPSMKHWESLVGEVEAAGDLRVCVSNEDFGRATDEQIKLLVSGLGGSRVHMVTVARRLDRYLPSQWQESVKAGETRNYPEWLRCVLDVDNPEPDPARQNVWFSHDTSQLVRRWAHVIGLDRVTVIASNELDHSQQARTFEQLLALPSGILKPHVQRSNRGLSWWETELVRQLNLLGVERGGWDYSTRKIISRGIVKDLSSREGPSDGPRKPPLPPWAAETVRSLSQQRIDALRTMGVAIVGDLNDLALPDDAEVGEINEGSLVGASSAALAVLAVLNAKTPPAPKVAQPKPSAGEAAAEPKPRKRWWPGAGSNRRPSDFQSDARTN
jgi:hypothetical protein